jgi:hypothetical protein
MELEKSTAYKLLFILNKENENNFLLKAILENTPACFEIELFYFEKKLEKEFLKSEKNSNEYKGMVFFFDILDYKYLKDVRRSNIIFMPDYTKHTKKKMPWWFRYRKYKLACFEENLCKYLKNYGFDAFYLKYAEPVEDKMNAALWKASVKRFFQFIKERRYFKV